MSEDSKEKVTSEKEYLEDQLKECNCTETSRAQYEKRFAKFL